ncbi:MAG: hypothetical protein J6Q82_06480 [Clostridia bacterium]|nr:hypothetical protein [Clostridia bacterium]
MKMMKRLIALGLSLLLLLFCFVGCSSKGPKMMKLGDSEITLNLFYLYLSRMKGTYCATYGIGAEDDEHWDTVMDASGKTYNEYYTEFVLEQAKSYLAACHVFDELGLELPDSYVEEIDSEIDRMIEQEADGSKKEFNKMLAEFGANVAILREAYLVEAKIAYLQDHLYGEKGGKIGGKAYEDYYQENYARFKHILFTTFEYVYEEDENGDAIYYKTKDSSRISYDTEKGKASDKKDINGDTIYLTEDGKIAYDKVNGQRRRMTNEDNTYQTMPLSQERIDQIRADVKLVHNEAVEGSYSVFDELVQDYYPEETYKNGYYITKTSDTAWNEVRDKVFTMEKGEIAEIESDWGIHIVMRYELEEAGYDNPDNADFFISTQTGTYTFLPALKQYLLSEYVKPYLEEIKLDEAILKRADMKSVAPNFYY